MKIYLSNQQHIQNQVPLMSHLLNCCISNSDWNLLIYLLETSHQHHSVNNKTSKKVYGKILQSAITTSEMHAGIMLFLSFYPEFLNTATHTEKHNGTALQIAANTNSENLVEYLLNQPGVDFENVDFDKFSHKGIKKMIKDKR